MSKKNARQKTAPSARATAVVRVELHNPTAREVWLAGNFNDWRPAASPMVAMPDGRWVKELTLPPGRYEYRFIVDGIWTDDPTAGESVDNGHGGRNAIRNVTLQP